MDIKHYNKLVRDAVPEALLAKGLAHEVRSIVDDGEFVRLLKIKLLEEAGETNAAKDRIELLKELADVVEVVHALCDFSGISTDELEVARQKKLAEKGGFQKRLFLVWGEAVDAPKLSS